MPDHHLLGKEDQQVLSTLEKICGIPRVCLEMQISNIRSRHLKEWRQYSRGRDLFISGLGSFDIEETYRNWVANRKMDLMRISEEIGAKAHESFDDVLDQDLELAHESFDDVIDQDLEFVFDDVIDQDLELVYERLDIIRRDISRDSSIHALEEPQSITN